MNISLTASLIASEYVLGSCELCSCLLKSMRFLSLKASGEFCIEAETTVKMKMRCKILMISVTNLWTRCFLNHNPKCQPYLC